MNKIVNFFKTLNEFFLPTGFRPIAPKPWYLRLLQVLLFVPYVIFSMLVIFPISMFIVCPIYYIATGKSVGDIF